MKALDKYIGCLIGGAVGDALGYEIEFLSENDIFSRFGKNGITEYVLREGVAEISDDTQMTLFTATGLLSATAKGKGEECYLEFINDSYKDWYKTQMQNYPLLGEHHYSWLVNVPEMFSRRAPGMTCLSAIENRKKGTIEEPINNSKGCGGIMRVAPIGLYFEDKSFSINEIDMIGAKVAALTHGHSLGYIPAAGLVHIVQLVAHNDNMTIYEAVEDMKIAIEKEFPDDIHLNEFLSLVDKAILLSKKEDISDLEAIRELGEGWVAEETLTIAIYCALKYSNDFEKAMIVSVNHRGDSDSTGAVTGNIVGAYLGLKGIPQKFLANLELKDIIIDIATDLYNDCKMTDDVWVQKYIENDYCLK